MKNNPLVEFRIEQLKSMDRYTGPRAITQGTGVLIIGMETH